MTKPLTLLCVVLLTVIALGVAFMAFNSGSTASSNRDADIQACARRNAAAGVSVRSCVD
jgi:hypothetical protein